MARENGVCCLNAICGRSDNSPAESRGVQSNMSGGGNWSIRDMSPYTTEKIIALLVCEAAAIQVFTQEVEVKRRQS